MNVYRNFIEVKQERMSRSSDFMRVNAIVYCGDNNQEINQIEKLSVENLKRLTIINRRSWEDQGSQSPYFIEQYQEVKTIWHPTEI